MSFVAISDVHIKKPGDNSQELFLKFLNSEATKNAQEIYLLGDIFDLLVGGHTGYLKEYIDVFEAIIALIKEGKTIHQFEGNHDFHFVKLIEVIREKYGLTNSQWTYSARPLVRNYGDDRILFAHGDELEIENENYQKYRKIVRSSFVNFLANKVVPYKFVKSIGENASKKSRKRNNDRYSSSDNSEIIRDRFRKVSANALENYSVNRFICGHSHALDFYETEMGQYSNNGYFPKTKTFTVYANGELHQETLKSS